VARDCQPDRSTGGGYPKPAGTGRAIAMRPRHASGFRAHLLEPCCWGPQYTCERRDPGALHHGRSEKRGGGGQSKSVWPRGREQAFSTTRCCAPCIAAAEPDGKAAAKSVPRLSCRMGLETASGVQIRCRRSFREARVTFAPNRGGPADLRGWRCQRGANSRSVDALARRASR